MTVATMLRQLEEVQAAKPLSDQQVMAYKTKLCRFTDHELDQIYDHVLEHCPRMPKIADLFESARELGLLSQRVQPYEPHVWVPTNCNMCGGEGLCAVTWEMSFEREEDAVYEVCVLKSIHGYSEGMKPGDAGYRTIYRCKCAAAEAKGVPRGIPRWNTDIDGVRRRAMSR
jgi:hypothetical protein